MGFLPVFSPVKFEIKMNFQSESYFFFSNNFKIVVLDSLISYFHIVKIEKYFIH